MDLDVVAPETAASFCKTLKGAVSHRFGPGWIAFNSGSIRNTIFDTTLKTIEK
jgi:hypothetical protein